MLSELNYAGADFFSAIALGDVQTIEKMLIEDPSLGSYHSNNLSPLLWSIKCRQQEAVSCLLQHGAPVEALTETGDSIFSYAVQHGTAEILNVLLDYVRNKKPALFRCLLDSKNDLGRTALIEACYGDFTESDPSVPNHLQLLLQCGENLILTENAGDQIVLTCLQNNLHQALEIVIDFLEKEHRESLFPLFDFSGIDIKNAIKLSLESGHVKVASIVLMHLVKHHLFCSVASFLSEAVGREYLQKIIDLQDNAGCTALMHACCSVLLKTDMEHFKKNRVDLLLEHGASFELKNKREHTALILASRYGCSRAIQSLILFIKSHHPERYGPFINQVDTDGYHALYESIFLKNGSQFVKLLLEAGCDFEVVTKDGHNIIQLCLKQKDPTILKAVLSFISTYYPENVDQLIYFHDKNTGSPLEYAVKKQQLEYISLLVNATGRYSQLRMQGLLHHAVKRPYFKTAELLINLIKEKFPAELQSFLDATDAEGVTVLMHACTKGNGQLVELLVNQGCSINLVDNLGQTALFYASRQNDFSVCDFLLRQGIDYFTEKMDAETQLEAEEELMKVQKFWFYSFIESLGLQQGPTVDLLKRYVSEAVDLRENPLILRRDVASILECVSNNQHILEPLDKIAANYLSGCVNQPVQGFLEILAWVYIAKKESKHSKVEALKLRYLLEEIALFTRKHRPVSIGFEVEFVNILLMKICDKLCELSKELVNSWEHVPTHCAYSHHISSLLKHPKIAKFIDKTAQKIFLLDTHTLLDYALSPHIILNWAYFGFYHEIKELDESNKEKIKCLQEVYSILESGEVIDNLACSPDLVAIYEEFRNKELSCLWEHIIACEISADTIMAQKISEILRQVFDAPQNNPQSVVLLEERRDHDLIDAVFDADMEKVQRLITDLSESSSLLDMNVFLNHVGFNGDTALMNALLHENNELAYFLLEQGARVDLINDRGEHALLYALKLHRPVELILKITQQYQGCCADTPSFIKWLNTADCDGNHALFYAVGSKNAAIITHLINLGCSLEHINNFQDTIFFVALELFSFEDFDEIISHLPERMRTQILNHQNQERHTLLMRAAFLDNKIAIRMLCWRDVAPGLINIDGQTALMIALLSYSHIGTVEALLHFEDKASYINIQDHQGMSALMWAASTHNHDAVAALLESQALTGLCNNDGNNALMLISSYECQSTALKLIFSALLSKMTAEEINQRNKAGQTALMLCISSGNSDGVSSLLKHGADLYQIDHEFLDAVEYAIMNDETEILGTLLKYILDDNNSHMAHKSWAYLSCAIKNNQPEALLLLLTHGANISACDGSGLNLLMLAAQQQAGVCLSALLDWVKTYEAADLLEWVNATDNNSCSALEYAISALKADKKIVCVLLENGANLCLFKDGSQKPLLLTAAQKNPPLLYFLLKSLENYSVEAQDSIFYAQDPSGETACLWAQKSGNSAMLELLQLFEKQLLTLKQKPYLLTRPHPESRNIEAAAKPGCFK